MVLETVVSIEPPTSGQLDGADLRAFGALFHLHMNPDAAPISDRLICPKTEGAGSAPRHRYQA